MLGGIFLADAHRIGIDAQIEIIPDRMLEFRLVGGLFQDFRIGRLHAGKGALVGRLADAGIRCRLVEIGDPFLEAGVGAGGRRLGEKPGREE